MTVYKYDSQELSAKFCDSVILQAISHLNSHIEKVQPILDILSQGRYMDVKSLKQLVKDERFIRQMTTPAVINSTRKEMFIEYIKTLLINEFGELPSIQYNAKYLIGLTGIKTDVMISLPNEHTILIYAEFDLLSNPKYSDMIKRNISDKHPITVINVIGRVPEQMSIPQQIAFDRGLKDSNICFVSQLTKLLHKYKLVKKD